MSTVPSQSHSLSISRVMSEPVYGIAIDQENNVRSNSWNVRGTTTHRRTLTPGHGTGVSSQVAAWVAAGTPLSLHHQLCRRVASDGLVLVKGLAEHRLVLCVEARNLGVAGHTICGGGTA
jgi:hypothetical protein